MTHDQPDVPRRYPSTLGGLCFLLMLVVTLTGITRTALVDWRLGVRVVAGALLGLALLRGLMPAHEAGMLAVRSRPVDVGLLSVVGVVLILLAATIPEQPALPVVP